MRIRDWISDVCSSDLLPGEELLRGDALAARHATASLPLHAHRAQFEVAAGAACFPNGSTPVPPSARYRSCHANYGGGSWRCNTLIRFPLFHPRGWTRSEEHTSELQSLMRISYAVFCLKKKKPYTPQKNKNQSYT